MFNTEKPQFTTYLWLFKKNIFFEINGEQVQENWIKNKKKLKVETENFKKCNHFLYNQVSDIILVPGTQELHWPELTSYVCLFFSQFFAI
jgi:hypothetical protein